MWEERLPPGQGHVRRPWVELGTRVPQVCPADSVALLFLVTLGAGTPQWELCAEPSDDSGATVYQNVAGGPHEVGGWGRCVFWVFVAGHSLF